MVNEKTEKINEKIIEFLDKEENEKEEEEVQKTTVIDKVVLLLKQKFKGFPEKELFEIANELAYGVLDAEARKHYALGILHRAKKYIHGYLKDYRIESEIQDRSYPLVLIIKVYF